MATSFSGGRSRSTRWEPPTMGKQLVNFITCGCESSAPFLAFTMRARTSIKGIYPQKCPSIWVLSNLVVSTIPLCSTNYVNNRHRLIWTLCKKYIQIGWKSKTFKILEIWTFRSLSVKFISETVKDRGNPSTYCRKLSIQFIQNWVKIGRQIKIL